MLTPPGKENVVEALADELTLAVLAGSLAPHSRLPSVRALSQHHHVNVSTIQRVLSALEERGVVMARPRSGVVVLDPMRHGGAALWPLLLRHASTHPEHAIALVGDALETRRVLALHVARTLSKQPFAHYGVKLLTAIDRFAEQVRDNPGDLTALADTENEILRTALLAAGRVAVLGVYNDIAGLMRANPALLQAFYREPALNLMGWRTFAEMLRAGGSEERWSFVEPLLSSIDEGVLHTFALALGLHSKPHAKKARTKPAPRSPTHSARTKAAKPRSRS